MALLFESRLGLVVNVYCKLLGKPLKIVKNRKIMIAKKGEKMESEKMLS